MKKSAYSLILSDSVVREIDKLAYMQNTNRSHMINQILAEYVSYKTPEKEIEEVFHTVEELLLGRASLQALPMTSDSLLSFRSAIAYKYNPTVKYQVVLYRGDPVYLGELRITMRTQNRGLTAALRECFMAWQRAEASYRRETEAVLEDNRYIRLLSREKYEKQSEKLSLGEAIAAYIAAFDRALKGYFEIGVLSSAGTDYVTRTYDMYYMETGAPL